MTDLDLAPLRDPDPPNPGERERALVDARARRLRVEARRYNVTFAVCGIALVLVAVLAVVRIGHDDKPGVVIGPAPTPTTAPAVDDRFVPPTHTENGKTVLPITALDGRHFELRYPPALDIASLGYLADVGVNWEVASGALNCCSKVVTAHRTTIARAYPGARQIAVYAGADGQNVAYVDTGSTDQLLFQFGPWLVSVYDVETPGDNENRMTEDQRKTWARSLTGTVDANGFLALHARAPLSIPPFIDIGFGDADARARETHVEISSAYCGQPESDSARHRTFTNFDGSSGVAWCEPSGLHVSASGPPEFVEGIDHGLQIKGP